MKQVHLSVRPSRRESAPWQEPIPVPTVDVPLPLFCATAPAELLPERPLASGYCEPVAGIAMREMFETAIFNGLFGPSASPHTLCFSLSPAHKR